MPFLIAPSRINGQHGFLFDEKKDLRCFYDETIYSWVIVDTSHTAPIIKVGENYELALRNYLYNDQPVWENYGGAVFNSITDGWIYNPDGLAEPYAEKDLDGETWIGNGWWKISKPNPDYPDITARPKGTFLNESESREPPVLKWWWPRWQWNADLGGRSRAPWGVYEGRDGAEDAAARRIVGSQLYRDGDRRDWVLALDKKSLSDSRGRVIRYNEDEDLWILGVKGVGTWWQSSAGPDRDAGMKLDAWKHDSETDEDIRDPDTDPVELTFYSFIETEGSDQIWVAEVALWR